MFKPVAHQKNTKYRFHYRYNILVFFYLHSYIIHSCYVLANYFHSNIPIRKFSWRRNYCCRNYIWFSSTKRF